MAPSDETRAYVQFLVPRALEPRLPGFLEALEQSAPQLGVTDIQIALSQLEEVFLRVALQVRPRPFFLIAYSSESNLIQSRLVGVPCRLALPPPRQAAQVVCELPLLQVACQDGIVNGQPLTFPVAPGGFRPRRRRRRQRAPITNYRWMTECKS